MIGKHPTRRDVVVAAAAAAVAATLPARASVRPEWVNLQGVLEEALASFREARQASYEARPIIMSSVRTEGILAFFAAPEIRSRSLARQAASAAAKALFMPIAQSDAEAALQENALRIFEDELGGSSGVRDYFPSSRRV